MTGSWRARHQVVATVALVLLCHACLLLWIAVRNSPNPDEVGHMGAGLLIWEGGRFEFYRVNPPLIRAMATAPVALARPLGVGSLHDSRIAGRSEWTIGLGLLRANRDRAMRYFAIARGACIPFGVLGGYFCWRWARELYGNRAGLSALLLWSSCPNVLAWGATICPDLGAAALGLIANFFFWRWLKNPAAKQAFAAGIALGLAELAKMTWIILFAPWPVIWLVWCVSRRGVRADRSWRRETPQLMGVVLLALCVLNAGYLFKGTFTQLADFTFASRTLAAGDSLVEGGTGGNRFVGTWLARVRLPAPSDYVKGLDIQKVDFERGMPSYLFGKWRDRGWWYFYLAAAAVKIPLGTWVLLGLCIGVTLLGSRTAWRHSTRLDEFVLLAPAVTLLILVSSHTGISRHFRYVLPALPLLFVWVGKLAEIGRRNWWIGALSLLALCWSVTSSLWIFPHSMSYFNELAGGPMRGHRVLLDSCLDWGQDVLYLRDWCRHHPGARPMHVVYYGYSLELLDIDYTLVPSDRREFTTSPDRRPGWYAVSVGEIYEPKGRNRAFADMTPAGWAGYSFRIYRID